MDDATVVDSLGKHCPAPVIDLAAALEGVARGDEVVLLADDPGARVDVPTWCRMKGHELVAADDTEAGYRFRVRCGG